MTQKHNTLFVNAQILRMEENSSELIHGAVGVVGNYIALVSDSKERIESFISQTPDLEVVDCHGSLLMPGLINTHTHVAMTLQRGTGDDIELMEWLNDRVWPFEDLQSDEDIEAGARLGVAEMLLSGTTTFYDMYWSEHYVANAVEDMGIRAVLAESCLPARMENFEGNLPKLIERAASSSRITAAIGPHAPYTCPPEVLERCVELSKEHGLPITIHLSESPTEAGIIKDLYDATSTEYLAKHGILAPSTILSHSIHLSDSDQAIIKQSGASVAHNPQCNMKIASGVAPITNLTALGVNCGLGTDGVCSNNDLDMWDEMRTASFLQKLSTMQSTAMPAYEILKMATRNGAKAIGMEGKLGVIAEGALADIIVMDIWRPHYRPHYDIVSSLVYCGKAADVDMVMVDGVMLVRGHELQGVDVEGLCKDVEQRTASIFARMK